MKNIIVLITLFLSILSCSTKKNIPQIASTQNNYYKIEVLQNEEVLKPDKENVIKLKKEPFKFKVTFIETDHIFVSSSWDKFYYDFPETKRIIGFHGEGEPSTEDILYKTRFVNTKSGNEIFFNKDMDLKIGSAKWHFTWYYRRENHSFDKIEKINDKVYGERTIRNINDMDLRNQAFKSGYKLVTRNKDGTNTYHTEYKDGKGNTVKYFYPINEVKDDIYLVFASLDYNNKGSISEVEQREKFILRFN